ncbi:MAG: M1 family metallopeptidase [Bacteroidota bacterium]|nr:M1 family metallopeptidase [Bacteroidota bacterium]
MKKIFLIFLLFGLCVSSYAQQDEKNEQPADTAWKRIYRGSYPRINDLVHTKLEVSFDYNKQWMYGKEWVTLQPHFYHTDSLTLDAKGMEIKEIAIIKGASKIPLKYKYDNMQLRITLDKTYKEGDKYTVYINYISKPNDLKVEGSAAITDAKGLYFINPKGETDEHIEIWTQGETESNSAWFPTIDKPDQKTTQEISMTVPSKYVTLSNGLLVHQKKNADGTRTDDWKMDLPNSPYLFFMGVGDYVIVKDKYKNMEVNYYVEKEYAPVAKKIFGETPAMIGFFSKILGVPYAWPKYDQIVGREYVSGAMENTTATLHQDGAYQNARQLVDGNAWEDDISHELFHHWFGDLVTCESWSNITVNESFANYSEYLWRDYRHGKDAADELAYTDMQGYLTSGSDDKNLVRFYYKDKEDLFDAVSYNKGGRILNMLRNYVGDSAFFKSLNRYLTINKFKPAEAQQLRLAFEDVTGQDLNWFWNQWYYGSGQPDLNITYDYSNGKARVIVEQNQKSGKIFKIPTAIDVYSEGANKKRYKVWLDNKVDTFYFASEKKPSFINVDADKVLLSTKTDNKTAEEFEQQYKYAPNYLDRREALTYFAKNKLSGLDNGLSDKYSGLRLFTLERIDQAKSYSVPAVLSIIEQMAQKDPNKKVQAKAIEILVKTNDKKYEQLFQKLVNDSSYSVSGAALEGLTKLNPDQAYTLAKKYSNDAKGKLGSVVSKTIMDNGKEEDFNFILNNFKNSPLNETKVPQTIAFANYLAKVKNADNVKKGVDEIMKFRNQIPEQYRKFVDPAFKHSFSEISDAKKASGNTELANYINGLLK